ncbi:hypothetical protein TAL182_CH03031 [Rhizobium sp. TAL182]|nr:hypothetical protein TAL182_CH03031 [Rhizobium sp. TAL182]
MPDSRSQSFNVSFQSRNFSHKILATITLAPRSDVLHLSLHHADFLIPKGDPSGEDAVDQAPAWAFDFTLKKPAELARGETATTCHPLHCVHLVARAPALGLDHLPCEVIGFLGAERID